MQNGSKLTMLGIAIKVSGTFRPKMLVIYPKTMLPIKAPMVNNDEAQVALK